MEIKPVAVFHSPFGGKFGIPRQSGLVDDVVGEVHLCGEYARPEALRGLDGFDYVWLLWEFSANRKLDCWEPVVRPPRLGGNAGVGVFASRSPYRPNPLGLSSVRVERVDFESCVIYVRGADIMDGTPIYDIKPYVAYADAHADARCGFVDERGWRELEVVFPDELADGLSDGDVAAIKGILAQDPRPQYQRDHTKVYGFLFSGRDVHFRVSDDGVATVTSID